MTTLYTLVPPVPVPPPTPPLRPFIVCGERLSPSRCVDVNSGPFTVEQYARWSGYSLTTAQAVLDQAVADGKLTST